ncbi:hypothetical protein WMY93_007373 [Mugilogobius chulae]|uniref:L1 transposable element RRM domain-containing protein n=1 Tax=Mugilogobius chulae TaxID=88201 RepID=A0AAW0PLU4_9GOBI
MPSTGDEEENLPLVWQKIEQSIIRSIDVRFNESADLEERIGGVENKAVNHEQRIKVMETSLEELRQQNKTLRSKLSDLEGRSRRNNLKIVGIPEGEEKGRPTDFVSHLIPKLFGAEHFDKPLAVDMAHRSLQPKPPDGSKPRTIIAKIHSLQDKEKIIRLGRQRTVEYGGRRIFIFPDYTAEVMEQRRSFKEIQQTLREKNIQHSLRFPARLHVHHQGQVKAFSSPAEAKNFVEKEL